MLVRQMRK